MKNLRNFIMAFVGFIAVAMCVTSCLSNEDDSLDHATQKQYQQIMAGPQTGKIRFYRQQGTRAYVGQQTLVKYDSIKNASWYIGSDSTITINNFPVYMLDSAIIVNKDATGDDAVKYRSLNQAIRALKNSSLGSENVKAFYAIPSTGWVSESVIQFMFQPTTIERTINFNGGDHKVYFVFNSYNVGAFSRSTREAQASYTLSAICIDKLSQQNAVPSTYFNRVGILLAK
ncbi:DUF4840 domain-containing protein [uncultured Prevotella sp.]|uniref:DUF4840 domain-containing protein n=1 Tax=uncultured Prevotella sp. TaxID=159272 RepID=UPI0026168494|nr:DUF4840 domain-containing protein [uncultured Prevotella sp.]